MSSNLVSIGLFLLSVAFYGGGFVMLTKNHLKHLADDVKEVKDGFRAFRKGQHRQDKRIERIETAMMIWTGTSIQKRRRR